MFKDAKVRHVSFVEDPIKRNQGELPLFWPSVRLEHAYDSVRVEVSIATYVSADFQGWLRHVVFQKIKPGGAGVVLAITTGPNGG